METPDNGRSPSDDDVNDEPDRLYDADEDGDEYAGLALSDEELAGGDGDGGESMSVKEWLEREPSTRDRLLVRIFGEEPEFSFSLGDGIVRWFVTRAAIVFLLAILISVLVSSLGWGTLFAGYADFQAHTGADPGSSAANISESVNDLVANSTKMQSRLQLKHQDVKVVDVTTGSRLTVRGFTGAASRSVYTVRPIGAVAPPPSDRVEDARPSAYGLRNTSESRSCLREWGDRSENYTRTLLEGENVTLVSPRSDDDVTSEDGGESYYLLKNNTTLSTQLLQRGLARTPSTDFPNQANFSSIRDRARENGTGIWSCSSA